MNDPVVIGWRETVELPEWGIELKAKADSGARTSAIDCAELVELPGNRVRFTLRLSRKKENFRQLEAPIVHRKVVRNSTGLSQERLFVETTMVMRGHAKRIRVSLVCRKRMIHRMLLGREALAGDFLVDCNASNWVRPRKRNRPRLQANLPETPPAHAGISQNVTL